MRVFIFLLSFIPATCFGATYYLSTTGGDSGHTGGSDDPWLTIQYAYQQMSGGDTLVIKDGTYTGSSNSTLGDSSLHYPPIGTSGSYTTIKAENDGGVIFDGEAARNMFNVQLSSPTSTYWKFEGLVFKNTTGSNITLLNCSYVKFLKCGAYDCGTGNNTNFTIRNGSYILLENCYAFGQGRYKFLAYLTDHVIFRSCVGRPDWINSAGDPIAIFTVYSSDDVIVQNCIGIDADQDGAWTSVGGRGGAFFVPCTEADSNRVTFSNCIALNSKMGGLQTSGDEYFQSNDVTYQNCAFWNISINSGSSICNVRGPNTQLLSCTFGDSTGVGYHYLLSYDGIGTDNDTVLKNSIFYGITGEYAVLNDIETNDYNSYYGNSNNNNSGAHDITNINPLTNSLLYITRIEDGSDLDGAGESGSDIGANIKTLIGTSGTLYGETGYNTDTGVSMWPFPNETLIRTKMKAYSGGGVSGDRGFCADGETLTHYIMNYLGNGNPYGEEPPAGGGESAYATSVQGGVSANATFR